MTIDLLSFLCAIIAYFLGCIPNSWLVVRLAAGKDIRAEGTGNMGAMNSYDVSGKKWVGIVVTILDALKGFAAVKIALLLGADFFGVAMAGVFVVFGHCFNIFFKFHGGRGLASGVGVSLALNPLPMILWLLMYLTGYIIIRRDVHVGSISGILGLALLLYTTPAMLLEKTMLVPNVNLFQFKAMVWLICLIFFIRHIEPMRELFRQLQEDDAKPDDLA